MNPQGHNQPPHDPSHTHPQNGAPYGAMPGQTPPAAPKKRGKGKFIALGCGTLALLVLLLFAGCAALLSGGDDSDDAAPAPSTTAQDEAPAEDAAADEAVEEPAAEEEAPAEEAPAEEASGRGLRRSRRSRVGTEVGGDLLGPDAHVQAGHLRSAHL